MEFRHEDVIPNEKMPIRIFHFEGAKGNYSVSKHWHKSIEVFYVKEGEINFVINSETFDLSQGNLILVNSNEIHSVHAPTPNNTIVLQIPTICFCPYIDENTMRFFQCNSLVETRKRKPEFQRIRDILDEMLDLSRTQEFAFEIKTKSLLYELEYILLAGFLVDKKSKTTIHTQKYLNRLSDIVEYIKLHYKEDITLSLVAKEFGLTPPSLSRFFRNYANTTFLEYVMSIRLEYAYKEIVNTDYTILDISYRNGFPNIHALLKVFRTEYRCTPNEYRKKYCKT